MRDVLLDRVRPLVERLAEDLAALAVQRIEAEITRMGEAFSVALSAYQSDGAPDLLTQALGPELAQMLTPPAKRQRDYKPENYPPSRRAREDRTALQANGKRPPTCQACGFVGGNTRGCGRSHPTLGEPLPKPTRLPATPVRSAAAVEADRELRRERIERVSQKTPPRSGRPPELGMRASVPRPTPNAGPAEIDEDDELERWSASRIAEETARAESSKHEGALPEPRSTFVL